MRIIESVLEMQHEADAWRREGKRIALVPTMGYLHEGHLSLVRAVRERADVVVMSIFVNPTQFGPTEDFDRYPRDLERDVDLAGRAGVDIIFAPGVREMYPKGYQTYVDVVDVTRPLCGRSRPGHFRGVTTVVAKLFNIVKPHAAIFGEKDFQQLVTIRRMAEDLNMGIEVLGAPTVREPDGLAMSSRNKYLTAGQRRSALRLSESIEKAQGFLDAGERRSERILKEVRTMLEGSGDIDVDYAELRDPDTLEEIAQVEGPVLLALAVRLGSTRLIDNRILRLCE